MGRVWLRARSACPPPFPVPVWGVRVCARVWVLAALRLSLGGCWGVCVLMRPSRVVSCTSWLGLSCGGASLCARPACSPSFLAGVRCVGVRAGPGSRLCPALLGLVVGVYFWACVGMALWCRLLAVPVPGPVVPVPPSPLFQAGMLALFCFFQRGVCLHISRCPFSRWAAFPGLPQCPGCGHWASYCCAAFVFGSGLRLAAGLVDPVSPGWGLGRVCLGTVCGVVLLLPAVCGVRGWT